MGIKKESNNGLAHLLMCPPKHFEVTYEINLWMQPLTWQDNASELKRHAETSWQVLYQTFRSFDIAVDLVEPQPELPDMVFTANSAIVLNKRVLLSRFRYKERQGEEKYFARCFEGLKNTGVVSQVQQLPDGLIQEGAGDCMWDNHRQIFWAGYGPRSNKKGTEYIQDYFGKEVIALELDTDRFYHLDISLSPLSSGEILYYPQAFSKKAQKIIEERVPADQLIAIDDSDANKFVCNLVNVGNKIILSNCSDSLKYLLRDRGYVVTEVPVDVFGLAGGSVCCLTLRLDQIAR